MICIIDHHFWNMSNQHTMSHNHILSVHPSHNMFHLVLNNNNMHHHNKLQQPMDHPIGKLLLMDGMREKLDTIDERLRADR